MHPSLRRSRGLGYGLPGRVRNRRPCAAASWVRPARDGRFSVAVDLLGADGAALRLAGDLDVSSLASLEAAMRRAERWSVSLMVVDAAEVGFIDLTVMGRLATAHRRLAAAGGGLLVIHPPQCLLRLLEILEELELPVVS